MKPLIVYNSIHHGNTKRIAKTMANILGAKLLRPHETDVDTFEDYDLIGFGSGIYFHKHHRSLFDLIDKTPIQKRKAFIFSTRGIGFVRYYHRPLKQKLLNKGFDIIGEFSCKGFDTFSPFNYIGGINKGRPNEKDLNKAKAFAEGLARTQNWQRIFEKFQSNRSDVSRPQSKNGTQ